MNTLDQFIAMYEPEGKDAVVFRHMLEKAILELTRKRVSATETVTMRDYFAGKVMVKFMSDKKLSPEPLKWHEYLDRLSKLSYEYADAMLDAREK